MTSFTEKFERLLDLYRKPDGSRWSAKDIEQATSGLVGSSYVHNLLAGRIRQPGLDRLKAIAGVMGFPPSLWLEEEREWERLAYEEENKKEHGLQERLNLLFDVIRNDRTGEAFTTREVAQLSLGKLTEEEIEAARRGELQDLKGTQYLALSEVFGVEVSYWYISPEDPPLLDHKTLEALRDESAHEILNKSHGLSEGEKDLIMAMLEKLESIEKSREGGE